jgi:hypothetical protein
MRSIKEIYEMRERGLFPCGHPRCGGYGNRADHRYGVVCINHIEILAAPDQVKAPELAAVR